MQVCVKQAIKNQIFETGYYKSVGSTIKRHFSFRNERLNFTFAPHLLRNFRATNRKTLDNF